ncbi:MAG: SMC-Scp complex subunit ScpB [Ignavibacteria bacterium CG_4_8_14_3_um_filter_37_9]|nr:MAG: SMC-Scp complex subunit ScpB [Ignavibacteria bacterium CG_4_8_14_3_um_filter_37_9]PJC61219.1 MAG: SMC-Scp complex subunit ScpB [Ignavibacteria bacterium CG_4_9_14_0_2_um_filter_37_13]
MDNIYNSVIEALIFSSDEPLKIDEIIKAIKGIDGEESPITGEDIEETVTNINQQLEEQQRPFRIMKIAGGFSFSTKHEYAKYIGYLSTEKSKRRLSQSALETLAIIAYKQPITKPEIEMIRGVNADYIMNTLLEKSLIAINGRAETVGRPLVYGTTDEFLKYFGLNRLTDLPKPREIDEIMQDEDFLDQKRKIMMNALEEDAEAGLEQEFEEEHDTQN